MVGLAIICILVILYVLYAPLAELLCKYLHMGTLYRGAQTDRHVALTFDDGPDPRYTPAVLDILRDHAATATFFLVAERAAAHPDLVARMLAEGHEVALHGERHIHAWLQWPWAAWRNVSKGKATLERVTGLPIHYFRPPWGGFTWSNRLAATALGLTATLWNVRAIDWLPGEYADEIVERVQRGLRPGAIILAHDAGGAEGAPLNTLRALPEVLQRLARQRFRTVSISTLHDNLRQHRAETARVYEAYPVLRRFAIRVWAIVEFGFARIYHVRDVNTMFRVSRTAWHHGERWTPVAAEPTQPMAVGSVAGGSGVAAAIADGRSHDSAKATSGTREDDGGASVARRVLSDGTPALDLHFQNETLVTFSSAQDNRGMVKALRMVRDALKDLAALLAADPRYRDIEAITAITLMNRGIEMLGFHVEDIPQTRDIQRLQSYMRFLMGLYHPEGFSRLKKGAQELTVRLIWMSKEELLTRYGEDAM